MQETTTLLAHYRKTHKQRVYGTSSVKYIRHLRPWIRLARPRAILDFGCGQSKFLDVLNLNYKVYLYRYDPAIPEYDRLPGRKLDLLISIDVLEHVGEAELDQVLAEMRAAGHNALIVIDTKPANHTLPDGRNAHVTLHTADWWQNKLADVFGYVEPIRTARRSRAAFKTWQSSPSERVLYYWFRVIETVLYYAKRSVGRHKTHWKDSSIRTT